MEYKITKGEINTRPNVDLPSKDFLNILTEEGIFKMVSDHYNLLQKTNIKGLFPPTKEGLEMAKKHSAYFFIQICGGERYFDEHRGRPMMKARHYAFKITQEARQIWLESYIKVLKSIDMDDNIKESFWKYIDIFSIWMMNSDDN
jgi:hemoglobin